MHGYKWPINCTRTHTYAISNTISITTRNPLHVDISAPGTLAMANSFPAARWFRYESTGFFAAVRLCLADFQKLSQFLGELVRPDELCGDGS